MDEAVSVDVVVIGGGVVGCAALFHLTQQGYRCLLLEKQRHLVTGASSGNSAMCHTGYDANPGLLESHILSLSRKLNKDHFSTHASLPHSPIGALMLAWNTRELEKIHTYLSQAEARGIEGVTLLSSEELLRLEPKVNPSVMGGLLIPGEAVVDSWLTPVYMVHLAKTLGAQVWCDCPVTDGQQQTDGSWVLFTLRGNVRSQVVVNAAGLHGDTVEHLAQPAAFRIRPRKGEYVVYGKDAGSLINHMLLPVPTKAGKGVIVFPSVYGNLVVGPTSVEVDAKEKTTVNPDTVSSLVAHAESVVPELRNFNIIGTYAGLRPATDGTDYHIYSNTGRQWVTVGGIRSTGVSACLAIASHVHSLVQGIVAPSGLPVQAAPKPYTVTNKPSIIIDESEYEITHPLTRFGVKPKL